MRLIDADVLMKEVKAISNQKYKDGVLDLTVGDVSDLFVNDAGVLSTEWWCVEDMIANAPTISQWIPCSERLPEAPAYCLVTTDGIYNDVIDIALYMSDGWHKASKVLAWMPLPKPYRGDDHEE